MVNLSSEETVRQYGQAMVEFDLPTLTRLRHPDWMVYWPQSGERVHGTENFAEIINNYPGGTPRTEVTRIIGSEDRWVVTPGNTVLKVVGSGDFWWAEWRVTYPNDDVYLSVTLIELRDGLVFKETTYWAAPFEAPAWRAPWVDRPDA
ncbi:MAG TPA: nuclear transport factor 2 family protein [Candidatus Limnocylindrales bacterium]|nr:nuclear transport factor 2 family protein [Candidatus Limnocylindrales bacterium]